MQTTNLKMLLDALHAEIVSEYLKRIPHSQSRMIERYYGSGPERVQRTRQALRELVPNNKLGVEITLVWKNEGEGTRSSSRAAVHAFVRLVRTGGEPSDPASWSLVQVKPLEFPTGSVQANNDALLNS